MKIDGSYNTATVHTAESREEAETEAVDQIQEMVNHEAFKGEDNIRIMPDYHWGAGAVIGFTMPVESRVVPNTIGVDIGCGMYATNLGDIDIDTSDEQLLDTIDQAIRQRIPTGFDVHNDSDYHMLNDFPYHKCAKKLESFEQHTSFEFDNPWRIYRNQYFSDLTDRIGYDQTRAINSVGTLGGGNHFIELGHDSSENVWSVIHSGSRGIGAEIAQYWQDEATNRTTMRQSIDDVPEGVREYLDENWKPKADKIRNNFSGRDIQHKFDEVSQAIQEYGPSTSDRNTDLDYLEGKEARGYIIDMVFAQTYASQSRIRMSSYVIDALNEVLDTEVELVDDIESVHNYIDFEDATIRKGACRAHENERLIIPFNIEYGTLIAKGVGNPNWNNSAPHGAGRAMSRTDAFNQFDDESFEEQTDGVYTSKKPVDEIPGAYKSPEEIEQAIGPTATVIDRIKPFLNVKAE